MIRTVLAAALAARIVADRLIPAAERGASVARPAVT